MSTLEILRNLEKPYLRTDYPPFGPGDTIRVYLKIKEAGKERVQMYRGVVISRRGGGLSESFVVRKISFGVGVERIFPLNSNTIERIEVESRGNVRRAKLFFLRNLRGRKSRLKTYEEFFKVVPKFEEEQPAEGAAVATPAPSEPVPIVEVKKEEKKKEPKVPKEKSKERNKKKK